jgi:outer membrane lipoprotein-sorting protein
MRSRLLILISLVVLAAVALVVGVAVAGADQSDPLPAVSAPELLAEMGQAGDVTAVSGEIAWHNGLFGDLSQVGSMAHLPAQSPLTSGGSGRIWVAEAGARVESQGGGGDQVVVVDKASRTAWVYDYAANTAKKVVVTGSAPAETGSPAPSAAMLTPEAITLYLQRLSAFATVEVAGQTKVAGRDTYQLRFTPASQDTALGYVQAAVDGQTMLPLQLEVYAKGGTAPVIKFGFTSVSYDAIDDATFTFTPPEGATVTTKTVDADEMRAELEKGAQSHEGEEPTAKEQAQAMQAVQGALLTREQVAKLVPYELAYARDYTARPYQWGYVLGPAGPLTGSGAPLLEALSGVTGMDLSAMNGADGSASPHGGLSAFSISDTTSVLLYGESLGTIVLAQTKTTPELQEQLKQARQASEILGSTTVNGAKALEVGTPLGGIIVWEQGDTTLIAGGMVPMGDLEAFAGSVR